MRLSAKILATGLGIGAIAAASTSPAAADAVADFYKGKTLTISVGYTAGGGYDVYARALAQYIGKHIPGNPTIVVKNVPGAGSLKLANLMYTVAAKDGTEIATVARGIPVQDLLGGSGVRYDANKFNWLGSMNNEVSVCVTSWRSPVKTLADMKKTEVIVGGQGKSSDSDLFAMFVKNLFDAKIKLISGYPGTKESILAMERGEVDGNCGWSWSSVTHSHMDWVKENKLHIIMQMALTKHPDLPNAPLILDLATTPEQKAEVELVMSRQTMGRPFLAPPDVPKDRVAALRKAFMDTMKDTAFVAYAEKAKMEITAVSGEDLQALVARIRATPAAIVKKTVADLQYTGKVEAAPGAKKAK